MISRYVSLAIVGTLMLILGITFFRVMAPFLLPLFLAAVVALIAQPIYRYFLGRLKNRAALAAGLATTSIVGAVVVPLFVGITVGSLQLFVTAEEFLSDEYVQEKLDDIKQAGIYRSASQWGERFFPLYDPEDVSGLTAEQLQERRDELLRERADSLRESAQSTLRQIAVTTFSAGTAYSTVDILARIGWTLMSLITFVMALYYFFCEGPKIITFAMDLVPVDLEHQKTLFDEFGKAVRAVVSATFLAAIAQGIATSAALWLLGFNHFFLFSIIATLAALIPLAGTWLVWLPCAVILTYQGSWGMALLLSIYGFGVVGTLDNLIRAYVLHSDAKLHPLLAFVSVLGGLQVMGLWGVFIAPIVACCLHALIRIFNEELQNLSEQPQPVADIPVDKLAETATEPNSVAESTAITPVEQPNSTSPAGPETSASSSKPRRRKRRSKRR